MYRDQAYILSTIIMIIDALLVIFAAYAGRWAYQTYFMQGGTWNTGEYPFAGFVIFTFFINNSIQSQYGFYSDQREPSGWGIVVRLTKAFLVLFAIISACLYFFPGFNLDQRYWLLFALILYLLTLGNKFLMTSVTGMLSKRGFHQIRILLVGEKAKAWNVVDALHRHKSWGHSVIGLLSEEERKDENMADGSREIAHLGLIADLRDVIVTHKVDEVIFSLKQNSKVKLKPYLDICDRIGVNIRIVPAMYSSESRNMKIEVLQGIPLLCREASKIDAIGLFYKRLIDICIGGIGTLFCFAILYPIIGIAIKLDSKGPVLFHQQRVGMHGRRFRIFKFRSMFEDAEVRQQEFIRKNELRGPVFKLSNDPRITRVGRFLRKTSLDEFPQFLNVLKGEMSLVGTRPPTPQEVSEYEDWHLRRISIKPGITGLWQISGRNKITDFNKIVNLDLQYIDQWKLTDDIKILWKTIWVVAARKGAC